MLVVARPAPDVRSQRTSGRALRLARETLLTVLALAGVAWLAVIVVSMVFGLSLVMFRTGSMSPTIPAGSVAVVREIPAAEAEVGDVVTVDRHGQLPITHRVTGAEPRSDGSALLTLRGDANNVADPLPYDVPTVRRVVWSVAGIGDEVRVLLGPVGFGLSTVFGTALVTWAFWPRRAGHLADAG